jgi:threonine 3-dehydrogenase
MPPEVASVQDPLGNAVHAILAANVAGKSVAIFGMGPIGLFAVGVARAVGASTILAVERYDYRLRIAEQMGADVRLNARETDVHQAILDETHGLGVDVVLEMSGSPSAVSDGLAVVRKGGEFVSLGIPSSAITLDYANAIVFKGLTLYGINGRKLFQTWYRMKGLLSSGRLDISPVITHRFGWDDYEEGFRLMTSRPRCCGKVVLFVDAEGPVPSSGGDACSRLS